ncbi:MAG: hypothetical protein N2517_03265 [Ignavibacteria bacterium]|nr:hypothetical protein [Ignavibacteria bacterium]
MDINPINIYRKYEVNEQNQSGNIQRLINEQIQRPAPKTESRENKDKLSIELKERDKIITKEERDFFVKLFPQSAAKIENHILFTRNGKLQSFNYAKGTIIDARV